MNVVKGVPKNSLIRKSLLTGSYSDNMINCPYCNSEFKDNNEMSKHIDRIHNGSGRLETI